MLGGVSCVHWTKEGGHVLKPRFHHQRDLNYRRSRAMVSGDVGASRRVESREHGARVKTG
jgi:hypothetical protein